MTFAKITGTGRYLPDTVLTNEALAAYVDTSDEWIHSRTGIRQRMIAVDEKTYQMAAKAGLQALEAAGVGPEELDLVVVATVSSEYSMPSIACLVQGEIGADKAMCFDINAACSGFVYSLDIAAQYIQSGKYQKALLVGVEKLSQLVDWEDRGTCVLFGDGAGAVVLEASETPGVQDVLCKAIGKDYDVLVSKIRHNDTPFYRQEEEHTLRMDGREVFQFAVKKVPECIEELMGRNQAAPEDVDVYMLHQANERIISKIAKTLRQDPEKFYVNIDKYGNTSAATIPIGLDELWRSGALEGKKAVVAGFGAGLTYAAALIQF
ncbi:beta-ketoacyl-ACP synthase III [Anaerotalea alkaliphila]|uniref:Beta-ketoacyl-[acyl-carrier-protein] synthase III n=1 Tax=Anaerotalea alkaliphila TaxID=2662126 RepID=A0A7X5KPG5_9FIRM|nr:beta-ketoacyl-ACP synthase III [Anaerotalea alkaliphila]NDL68072.1 ketoacyl-ACP synthase III [Anaerotalea alkaliphila]